MTEKGRGERGRALTGGWGGDSVLEIGGEPPS